MVDKIFKLMGLNGKAVLPMVLGLGCDTMATMTTRILETKKERVIVTLLLALGVPCSAQLGVILGMLSSVSMAAAAVWAGVVLSIIFTVGFLASKVLPGEASDFILEIPPMRVPQFSNIVLKTLVRVEWYLKEALPLFILGTFTLFVLDKTRALGALERLASPVVKGFLGLPVEATQAFIVGFLRRDYGAAGLLALQKNGMLDPLQVVVSLVTITLFIPCIANLFMIIKERGVKAAVWMTAFIFPFAFLVGGVLNQVLRALKITL
ncbi:MAG: ferrous iron transporter B [Deltaproteobacteria bacterium]|nr:ferrous iron transporter B [Deltaproteobacteria bacterium]